MERDEVVSFIFDIGRGHEDQGFQSLYGQSSTVVSVQKSQWATWYLKSP